MNDTACWIDGPWRGRPAILPRPRGGDWLADDVKAWENAGIALVASLLTEQEDRDFELEDESAVCASAGLEFRSLPIADPGVPPSRKAVTEFLRAMEKHLGEGRNLGIHCRQGIGRSSLVAASLLVLSGLSPADAFRRVSTARGCEVPETEKQR